MNRAPIHARTATTTVALMLVTVGLLAIVPTAPGTHDVTSPGPPPVGFTISEDATTAGPAQKDTKRFLDVTNQAPANELVRLSLFAPTKEGTPVRSIDWDDTHSSGPAGWGVEADNSDAQGRRLTFAPLSDPPSGLGTGETGLFVIAFDVMGSPPEGEVFNVTVRASFKDTVTTLDHDYDITIDSTPPAVLPTGVITLDMTNETVDTPNGQLDHILVVFSEIVDQKTFEREHYRLEGYNLTGFQWWPLLAAGDPITAEGNEFPSAKCPSELGCSQVLIQIAERTDYDTGALPQFTTLQTTLKDVAGNLIPHIGTATVTEVDGAHPVLVGASAKDLEASTDGYEAVRLRFSEKVRSYTGADVDVLDLGYNDTNRPVTTFQNGTTDDCTQLNDGNGDGTPGQPGDYFDDGTRTCQDGRRQHHDDVVQNWDVKQPPDGVPDDALEWVEVTFVSTNDAKPLNEVDVNLDFPDRFNCAGLGTDEKPFRIVDLSSSGPGGNGLPCKNWAMEFKPFPPTPIRLPRVVSAEINIGTNAITVTFSTDVSDARGDNIKVPAEAFDIVPTDGGGPQGIDEVRQARPCFNKVIIILDRPVRPTDVDLTPSNLRVLGGAIKACGTGAANPLLVPGIDAPLQDGTPPAVSKARTVDQDSNGVIDGFFLEFSEPVDDATYCLDSTRINSELSKQRRCPHVDYGDRPGETGPWVGLIQIADADQILDLTGIRWFYYDTDKAVNDRFAIISWDEPDPAVGPVLDTGFVPELFLAELSAGTGQGTDNVLQDLSRFGNRLKPTTPDADSRLDETDGAPPVVLRAETIDSQTRLQGQDSGARTLCVVGVDRLCEEDPDGFIDGYRLTFSEPVRDATFDRAHWRVEGRRVTGITTDHVLHVSPDGDLRADRKNDTVMVASFCRGPERFYQPVQEGARLCSLRDDLTEHDIFVPDTDEKPQLLYTKPPPALDALGKETVVGLQDMVGNPMETIVADKLAERDGARPVIVYVEGFVNQSYLRVVFSEPADDGLGEPLVRSDFVYANGNKPTTGGEADDEKCAPVEGARPSTTGLNNTVDVEHEPGDEEAILALNRPLSQQDIECDKLGAHAESIRESTFGVLDKRFALTTFKSFNKGLDIIPPGLVEDVAVDLADANSVTLRWKAPGDDGEVGDPVFAYRIKVEAETFTTFADDEGINATLPATSGGACQAASGGGIQPTFVYTPSPLAGPGGVQRVKIVNLAPESTYYFGVRAIDDDKDAAGENMIGPFNASHVAEATTLDDQTAPAGPFNTRSTSHPAGRPVFTSKASFNWDSLEDEESTVVYYWALSQDHTVRASTDGTCTLEPSVKFDVPGEGSWYLHVTACSGGGCTPMVAPYNLVYRHDEVDPVALRDYNILLSKALRVHREGDENVLEWDLPPAGEVGDMEAVRVWHVVEGSYELLDTVEGDFSSLQNESYRHEGDEATPASSYMIDAVFATDQQAGTPSLANQRPVAVQEEPRPSTPTWVWVALVSALVIIIGGIVAFAIVRARHVPPASYLDEEVGVDEETGLPSHKVTCPQCSHGFSAVGHAPLEITCPECGTVGVLE